MKTVAPLGASLHCSVMGSNGSVTGKLRNSNLNERPFGVYVARNGLLGSEAVAEATSLS